MIVNSQTEFPIPLKARISRHSDLLQLIRTLFILKLNKKNIRILATKAKPQDIVDAEITIVD